MARGDASDQIPQIDPQALTEEQKQEAAERHRRLFEWLLALPAGLRNGRDTTMIFSRQSIDHMWEPTGLWIDPKVNVLFGKIGKHAYQPLGRDNGEYFVPLVASQIFWAREFILADITKLSPAFDVEAPTPAVLQERDPVAFTDAERADMQGSYEELLGAVTDYVAQMPDYAVQVEAWERLTGKLGVEPSHPDEAIFDAIKVAALSNSRIEKYLSDYDAAFNSQHGKSMYARAREGHTFHAIAKALTEWINMKLTDDQARRLAVSELKVPSGCAAINSPLREVILRAIDGTADDQGAALDIVYSASVTLRNLIEDLRTKQADQLTIFQTVRSVLNETAKESDDLNSQNRPLPQPHDSDVPPSNGNPS